jgi:hypothetical protein
MKLFKFFFKFNNVLNLFPFESLKSFEQKIKLNIIIQ